MKRFWPLLILSLCAVPAWSADFDLGYIARVGDFDGDGRQDIYLDYRPNIAMIPFDDLSIPVPTTRRQVGDFVLRQNETGGFDLVTQVSSSQKATMRNWVVSAIEVVLGDVNVDRVLDLVLKNVSGTIPGATDAVVFGPSSSGPPTAMKSVDTNLTHFINDLNGFAANPAHYYDNAWLPAQQIIAWPVNVYRCDNGYFGFLEGDPQEVDAWLYCEYEYTYIDYFEFDYEVLDTSAYSAEAYYTNQVLAPYGDGTSTVTVTAADAAEVVQRFSEAFGVPFAPGLQGGPIVIEPQQVTKTGPILRAMRILGRVSIIAGIFFPNETASDDTAKPYFPYAHYSYRVWRFRLLQGLNPGSWVTPEAVVNGATAQQKYSLPIHFPDDAPPDCWFLIYVGNNVPRLIKLEGPETYTSFGITRTRTGGGTGVRLYSAIPPIQITGPFELPP